MLEREWQGMPLRATKTMLLAGYCCGGFEAFI